MASSSSGGGGGCSAAEASAVEALSSPDDDVRLKALREVKNQVIGNRTKKAVYVRLGAVPKVADILASSTNSALLVQSAATLGSFAYGLDAGVIAVLESGAIQHLIHTALSHQDEKVVEAGMRALKMVYQNQLAPRERIFEPEALYSLVALLKEPGKVTAEVAARILERCCVSSEQQSAAVAACGLELLVPMLDAPRWSAREAAMQALVAIVRDNPAHCQLLVQSSPRVVEDTLRAAKEQRPRIRLAAVHLLVHFARSCPPSTEALGPEYAGNLTSLRATLLPILMKLLGEAEVREEVPRVLSQLVEGSEALQRLAADADAISKLARLLQEETCSCALLEGTLLALGTLCMEREESRKQLMEAKVLGQIVRALDNQLAGVREAACLCVRSLSRTVKMQRSALMEADVAAPMLRLLRDPSADVQQMASATICNMVLDFSMIKEQVLKMGGVTQLVELARSMDTILRKNAVCALKNLVYHSDVALKEAVVKELGWSLIQELVDDPEEDVAVEGLNLLRNLLHKESAEIELVMCAAGGPEQLLAMLTQKLDPERRCDPRVQREALIAISNIATGSDAHKELVMGSGVLQLLLHYMRRGGEDAIWCRLYSAWTVINLTYLESAASEETRRLAMRRAARMLEAGVEAQLAAMEHDPSQDVHERVTTALKSIKSLLEQQDAMES
eukprot:jgi/Tetstr1/427198/TSEL_017386.t1